MVKPGCKEFRMTIDNRPVNKQTADTAPNMDTIAHAVEGVYGFSIFDLPKGFFQYPLDEDSQELMNFISKNNVYSPTRVPQGAMDSSVHSQNQMEKLFA
ncbi:hypothetical protein PF003_g36867 [Phytophthora fragariae]|nr:hypothetical protein PF003_g36867 [Phytophthora fragariae]